MLKVTVDASVREKLAKFTEIVEICDESGQTIGQFLPILELSEYEPLEPQISEEELDRRDQESESFTTAEVLAYLEKL